MNGCEKYLHQQGAIFRAERAVRGEMAERLGISADMLDRLLDASVKSPGVKWDLRGLEPLEPTPTRKDNP